MALTLPKENLSAMRKFCVCRKRKKKKTLKDISRAAIKWKMLFVLDNHFLSFYLLD